MERETGIEPATSSLGSWRSTAELLPLSVFIIAKSLLFPQLALYRVHLSPPLFILLAANKGPIASIGSMSPIKSRQVCTS